MVQQSHWHHLGIGAALRVESMSNYRFACLPASQFREQPTFLETTLCRTKDLRKTIVLGTTCNETDGSPRGGSGNQCNRSQRLAQRGSTVWDSQRSPRLQTVNDRCGGTAMFLNPRSIPGGTSCRMSHTTTNKNRNEHKSECEPL